MKALDKIELIFCEALERDTEDEREAYLDEVCRDDPPLRVEIDALLKGHFRTDSFIKGPILGSQVSLEDTPLSETPGSVIGRYKLLEKIGEGGMAVVYMAEQQEPIRRKVALKIIKLGMDTKSVIARFEAERQALAIMDHPNIAKVLDAGATETGRPYFVMELVTGVSITEYCDINSLRTKQRLALFIEVCNAVQHAHQKGIIHRDIKPSNVMVTLYDGKPIPKVIDFGVAKATNQRLTEKTMFTRYAHIIGTPAYMSPEQAEMSGLDIDTRSDIYSLGVLLYELLTGATPFCAQELLKAGYVEMQRIIREEQPAVPSTKLSTMGETLAKIAQERKTSPDGLRKLIRGDLDWIVMKSLDKDRTRRYTTASEFATDIERHLSSEPVLAGPPSAVYRMKKFVRRRRGLVAATTAVAASLLVGFLVSTFLYVRVRQSFNTITRLETIMAADSQLSTAQKLYAEGRYQAAVNELEANLQGEAADPKIRLLHARILPDVGRALDAEIQLQGLVKEEPQIAGAAHYLLARINLDRDVVKSREHRQQAELLLPRTAEAYAIRALTAETPDVAIRWLTEALQLDPGHYASRKARALAHYGLRDYVRMWRDVEALIATRPKDYLGYALRALAQRETGELEEALTNHNRAIELCEIERELPILHDQRQETYWRLGDYQAALQDAQGCIDLAPETPAHRVALGRILFKLGRYEDARGEFARIKSRAWQQILRAMIGHAFDVAEAEEPLNIPRDFQKAWPFLWMPHYVDLYKSLGSKATRLIRGTMSISSWSPDGKELAYTRSEFCGWDETALSKLGSASPVAVRGIEVLDIESGHVRVLTTSGGSPAWSPDGLHIAFVRARDLAAEQDAEIWLVPAAGGDSKRLVEGGYPGWTNHPTRLYYHCRKDNIVCYIDVADPTAAPVRVAPCPGLYPHVSPDERFLAYATAGELTVVELASGEEVVKWVVPGPEPYCCVRWSPDGKEISLSVLAILHYTSGLWVYDFEHRDGRHVLDAETICCNWSPDRSKVAIDVFFPVSEIWLAEVDPNLPTWETLAPVQTRGEYLRSDWHEYVASYARIGSENKRIMLRNLIAVGVNQYECGEYEDALWTLQQVGEIPDARSARSDVQATTYIAMALGRLDRHQEAQQALGRVRSICARDESSDEMYLYEAEKALAPQDSKLRTMWGFIQAGQLDEALELLEDFASFSPDIDNAASEEVQSVRTGLARAYWRSAKEARHGEQDARRRVAYYEAALRADPNCIAALRDLAWLLAVCSDADIRDGTKALVYAEKACELTEYKDSNCLAGLAAAHAERDDFYAAAKWQQEAIEYMPEEQSSDELAARLELYKSAKHVHAERIRPLVAWWKLEKTDSVEVRDSSGNDLHGTLVGDAAIVVDPDRGDVLSLDGEKSWVDCGSDSRFNLTSEATISAWVKVSTFNRDHQAIVGKGNSAWRLQRNRKGFNVSFCCTGLAVPDDAWSAARGTTNVNDGNWHHIVGVYDATQMYLYIDGELNVSARAGGRININDEPVCIGANSEKQEREWNGLIDDVRIYNYGLTQEEVRSVCEGENYTSNEKQR